MPVDAVPAFAVDEQLFRRCTRDEVAGDRLEPMAIDLPGTSVNRSMFSGPTSVLGPGQEKHGVARFIAGDLPPPYTATRANGRKDPIRFEVAHVPIEGNDAHAEIRVMHQEKGGTWTFWTKLQARLPLTEQTLIQAMISERSRVIIAPQE
jgi:hypothetical protein